MKNRISISMIVLPVLVFSFLGLQANHHKKFCGRPMKTNAQSGYIAVLKQFKQLECEVGIQTAPASKPSAEQKKAWREKLGQEKGPMLEKMKTINTARSELNNLLSKKGALTDSEQKTIKEKIEALAALNPTLKPRAQDYQAILDAKIRIGAGLLPESSTTEEFLILEQKAGIDQVYTAEIEGKAHAIRVNLNALLAMPQLTETNIAAINEGIKALRELDAKWPGADDYTAVLLAIKPAKEAAE
jgi:hypothetical protein